MSIYPPLRRTSRLQDQLMKRDTRLPVARGLEQQLRPCPHSRPSKSGTRDHQEGKEGRRLQNLVYYVNSQEER